MTINFNDEGQRSLEWYRSRLGKITGSRVSDIMKSGRKKDEVFSVTAKSYLYQLAGERMFNPVFVDDDEAFGDYIQQTNVTTKAMQWGIEQEAAAKRLYMKLYGGSLELIEVSSCTFEGMEYFAASPDGILRNVDGLGNIAVLEVKCPSVGTFAQYSAEIHDAGTLKAVKPEYYWQMQAEMACTGAAYGVFIAYQPYLLKPLHHARIERNADDVQLMLDRVKLANEFIENVNKRRNGD